MQAPKDAVLQVVELGRVWPTIDPFLFCVHHDDDYPEGDDELGPCVPLVGRDIGQDFSGRDANSLSAAEQARVEMEAALARNIVYFEYDQDTLTSEGASTVRAFADYLLSNPAARVRLEGHADERGTREYNLALAERRSRAVEAALTRAGVTSAQITSLSYGEERPTCVESTESCWSQNRRVEIIRL